jgi:8-oxo-dGTP pyrophosphatase MutT (NUDIX family)
MKKIGPWKYKGTKLIYKNKFVEYHLDQIISSSGKLSEYNRISLPDGVLALPVDENHNVYLTKQFRYISGRKCLEAAGGHIDKSETPMATAKRELREELGITVKRWISMGAVRPAAGIVRNIGYLFIARDLQFGLPNNDVNEKITIVRMPLAKAIKLVMDGTINHAPSCVLILKAEKYLKKK